MIYSKEKRTFITGVDVTTEWMLPWFVDNFKKHNKKENLVVYDFGMSADLSGMYGARKIKTRCKSWFKKPATMLDAAKQSEQVCWIDSDCEVLGDISGIWDHIVPNKLLMGEDKPWSRRQGTKWHNSGVVAFQDTPRILKEWDMNCAVPQQRGDQEVLHWMIGDNAIMKMSFIEDLPNKYNVLRIQKDDGSEPKKKLILHHTGRKGKLHIERLING